MSEPGPDQRSDGDRGQRIRRTDGGIGTRRPHAREPETVAELLERDGESPDVETVLAADGITVRSQAGDQSDDEDTGQSEPAPTGFEWVATDSLGTDADTAEPVPDGPAALTWTDTVDPVCDDAIPLPPPASYEPWVRGTAPSR